MDYLAFTGYWFFTTGTSTQRAALFCSYGLLDTAPTPTPSLGLKGLIKLGLRLLLR